MRRALTSAFVTVVLVLSVAVPVGATSSPGTLVGFRPVTLELTPGMEAPIIEVDLVDSVSSLHVFVDYVDDQGRPAFHFAVPDLVGEGWPGGDGTFVFAAHELIWFPYIYGPATVSISQVCLVDWSEGGTSVCYSGDQIRAMGTQQPEEPEEPADSTPPTVWFEGYQEQYGLTDEVEITCGAEDEESGIASLACASISGAALDLFGQTLTATATATDAAGNSTTLSEAFTINVLVDVDGLIELTRQRVTKHGVAKALVAKLRNGAFDAYAEHVRAQAGKSMTLADAELLTRLAQQLG